VVEPACLRFMKKMEPIILLGAAFLLLLLTQNAMAASSLSQIFSITDWLIPEFESFSPTPYWDVSRYSWGYGTPAPGATGTITRQQALPAMRDHITTDYTYLRPLVTRPLKPHQWAAYLSFAYNLGDGNADNLIENINSGDDAALEIQWKKYVKAGGRVSDDLVARRAKEWELWVS
jgi:lysozyme